MIIYGASAKKADPAMLAGPMRAEDGIAGGSGRHLHDAGAPTPEAVLKQLQRILSSSDFDASERNRRFLRYVVEEVLAGRAERIKAYSIATTVFGRDTSFDPQTDAIVRIEARRLRRSLERYYLTFGKSDLIRITIPKGSYGAQFETATPSPAVAEVQSEAQSPSNARGNPAIFVASFEEDGDLPAFSGFTRGFTRQIVASLTRFTDFRVYGPDTSLYDIRARPCVDYILRGGATLSGGGFALEALLIDARSGRNLWSATFERTLKPAEIVSIRNEIAHEIARTLAQPYGVIFSSRAQECEGKSPDSLSPYECVSLFHKYCRSYSPELHNMVRSCLEKAIIVAPEYAEAFACLSLAYSDAYQFGLDVETDGGDPRQRALKLAMRAVELAPYSSRAHQALSQIYWLSHDHTGSVEELKTGRSLNPNDAAILADLGLRYAMLAEWDKAVPLLEQSYAYNPFLPDTYRIGLALFHYVHGRYEHALAEARKAGVTHAVLCLLEAIAAGQLGRHKEAEAAVQRVWAINPDYRDQAVAYLRTQNLGFDLIQSIVDGLRKAGLAGAGWRAAIRADNDARYAPRQRTGVA